MRNFFYKIANAVARFMYGRNGSDQLNLALLVVYCAVLLVQIPFAGNQTVTLVLHLLTMALVAVIFFRMFSKNLPKRRAENTKFLAWWYPIKNRVTGARQRRQDKEHKYFTCKNCKTICRVPAGKGKLEITCPKCGNTIIGKS